MAPHLPDHLPAIAESGIDRPYSAAEAARLGYRPALVGSSLVPRPHRVSTGREIAACRAVVAGADLEHLHEDLWRDRRRRRGHCVEAGVDAVGFVFSESPVDSTPRRQPVSPPLSPPGCSGSGVPSACTYRGRCRSRCLSRRRRPGRPRHPARDRSRRCHAAGFPGERRSARRTPPFSLRGADSGVGQGVDLDQAAQAARLGEMVLAGGLDPTTWPARSRGSGRLASM